MNRLEKLSLVGAARLTVLVVGMLVLFLYGIDILFKSDLYLYTVGLAIHWVPFEGLGEIPLVVLGSLGILIPIFYLAIASIQSRLENGIVGKGTDGDDICLAPSAIERTVVRNVRQNIPEVRKVRGCSATQGTKGVKLTIRIAADADTPVTVVRSKVKADIVNTLERLIGYRQGATIRVKVTDVISSSPGGKPTGRKKKKPRQKEVAAEK